MSHTNYVTIWLMIPEVSPAQCASKQCKHQWHIVFISAGYYLPFLFVSKKLLVLIHCSSTLSVADTSKANYTVDKVLPNTLIPALSRIFHTELSPGILQNQSLLLDLFILFT